MCTADKSGFSNDLAGQALRQSVGADFPVQACGQRETCHDIPVTKTGRQKKITGGHMTPFELNTARAVPGRLDRRAQSPRPLRIVRPDGQHNAAASWPLETEADIVEDPMLACAFVVNSDIPVLEPELAQIVAVEPGLTDAVDPGQQRGKNIACPALRSMDVRGRHGSHGFPVRWRCSRRFFPLLLRCTKQGRGGRGGYRSGCDRMLVGTREDRHAPVLLAAHGHFGTDQIEAFRAHVAAQQAHARNADLGLRRARDHGTVGVAYDDVANANGGRTIFGALDLGAADFDAVTIPEILFHGGYQPGRHDIELNGAARKPPPKAEASHDRHGPDDADTNREAPDEASVS